LPITVNGVYFENAFTDVSAAKATLCKLGFFSNTMACSECQRRSRMSYVKRKSAPDGCNWAYKRPCMYTFSLKKRSFFDSFKIGVKTTLKATYKYLSRLSFVDIAYELNVCRKTTSKMVNLVRECICEYMSAQTIWIGWLNE